VKRQTGLIAVVNCFVFWLMVSSVWAQQAPGPANRQGGAGPFEVPQDHRPPLFFREDFKAPPNSHGRPLAQTYIANPNLQLKMYGAGEHVEIAHHEGEPKDDPIFLWTGFAPSSWAVAFKEKNSYVDLTGLAKIRWRTQQTGFHELRPILKLANGTWLVGDYAEGWTPDWRESEFWPAWIRWRRLDINNVLEAPTGTPYENGRWELNPDLSKVDEIGFTDLMAGSGHGQGGWSRIDWIEVYGSPIKREATPPSRLTSRNE
jgi:hypothetical protein